MEKKIYEEPKMFWIELMKEDIISTSPENPGGNGGNGGNGGDLDIGEWDPDL
jgi:hypothetical protein